MKKLLIRAFLLLLTAAAFLGCDQTYVGGVGDFSLTLKTAGPDYAEYYVTAPGTVEMAYVVSPEPQTLTAPILFMMSESGDAPTVTVSPKDVVRFDENLQPETVYFLYAAAKLPNNAGFSKLIKMQFKTGTYKFDNMLTVVERKLDGYRMHIKIPEETKKRGNVIRYGGTSKAWFNVLKNSNGSEVSTIMNAIIATGNPYGNYLQRDTTVLRDNTNIIELDENGNPVLDELGQQIDIHNPISPGEPVIFFAGEVMEGTAAEMDEVMGWSWGQKELLYCVPAVEPVTEIVKDENGNIVYQTDENDEFILDEDGNKIPLLEIVSWNWVGAFEKCEFIVQEPEEIPEDGPTVRIEVPKEEIEVTNAKVYFDMDEGVSRYFYMILDDVTYNNLVEVYLDKTNAPQEEIDKAFQWFLTSYLAYYEWRVFPYDEDIEVNAASHFADNVLMGGETYHVLCTVQIDDEWETNEEGEVSGDGKYQRFVSTTFKAAEKSEPAPVVTVTPVETSDPYFATFNIKAPNKDLVAAYWAANYAREFQLMLNANYTYEQILKGNYTFEQDEIAKINTDEGLNVKIACVDGETTRFVVYGVNKEYTFNRIDPETPGVGWNDVRTRTAPNEVPIVSDYFNILDGEWTATATLKVSESTGQSINIPWTSKITISNEIKGMPEKVEESVYPLYKNDTPAEVDDMYASLLYFTDLFNKNRLAGRNRMLCTGWFDYDNSTKVNRLSYRNPYDLFKATDYNSIDVPQLIFDFGPKWFIEVMEVEEEQADGTIKTVQKLIVPFNSANIPPMSNWAGYPLYVSAVGSKMAFYDTNEQYPGFPVEVSADGKKLTIKPIVIKEDITTPGEKEGDDPIVLIKAGTYYMNALGINPSSGAPELISTIQQDIVLTKGWNGTKNRAKSASGPKSVSLYNLDGTPVVDFPEIPVYKSFTKLEPKPVKEYKKVEEANVVTMDMVNRTTDKILEYYKVK